MSKCCEKCSDVHYEKTYPEHTAYEACINQRCDCHASEQKSETCDDCLLSSQRSGLKNIYCPKHLKQNVVHPNTEVEGWEKELLENYNLHCGIPECSANKAVLDLISSLIKQAEQRGAREVVKALVKIPVHFDGTTTGSYMLMSDLQAKLNETLNQINEIKK